MLVFLIGFMGAGKTTAGQLVAQKSGCIFIDLDAAIEMKTGKSINELFTVQGEEFFRRIEADTLRELEGTSKAIVAVGGGCASYGENMEWMNENGNTIYLKANLGTLFHRLMPSKKNRPLVASLTDVQLMEYIISKLPQREKHFCQAHYTVETATEQPSVLVVRILETLKKAAAHATIRRTPLP